MTNSNIFPNSLTEVTAAVATGAGVNLVTDMSPLISALFSAGLIILCDKVVYPICLKIVNRLWPEKDKPIDKETK
jgi:hypothetical protein